MRSAFPPMSVSGWAHRALWKHAPKVLLTRLIRTSRYGISVRIRLKSPLHPRSEFGMLILTRKIGESLMIGEEVTCTVLGVKGNQVRVGINAPKSVAVHREGDL